MLDQGNVADGDGRVVSRHRMRRQSPWDSCVSWNKTKVQISGFLLNDTIQSVYVHGENTDNIG